MYSVFSVKELFSNIVTDLEPKYINALACVNHTFHKSIERIGREIMQSMALGSKDYQNIFKLKIEEVELPKNIYSIYNMVYQFSLEKDIVDKPILYIIDPHLTLVETGKLMQPFFKEKTKDRCPEMMQDGYYYFSEVLLNKSEKGYTLYPKLEKPRVLTHTKPYWGILINGVMFKGSPYKTQKKLVNDVKISGKSLQLVNAEEGVIGVFLHWVKFKKCNFNCRNQMRTDDKVFSSSGSTIVTIENVDPVKGVDIGLKTSHQDAFCFGVAPFFSFD